MTAPDPIQASLDRVLRNLGSEDSRRVYENAWINFTIWLKKENLAVEEAKPRHIEDHLAYLQEKGNKRTTCSRDLSVIRAVYSILVRDEVVAVNPAREVKLSKSSSEPKAPFMTEDKVKKLFELPAETWKQRRARVCLCLLFGLGWRRTEVAMMHVGDFQDATVTGILKGKKRVTVGVPEWVSKELAAWLRYADIKEGPVLPRSFDDPRACSGDMVYNIVKEAVAEAGLGHYSPHSFRRTYITVGGKRGVSLKERQLAVGHSSQSTTERYDKARDAAGKAPGQVFVDLISPRKKT